MKPYKKSKARKLYRTPSQIRNYYIRKVFTENNDYPLKVVNDIIDQELSQSLEVVT